jgi:hypothetical protein
MAETASAKVCIHCGQDCSKKARTKDAQGRYACKECHEAALAKAAAAAAAKPVAVARSSPKPAEPDPIAIEDDGGFDPGVLQSALSNVAMPEACPSCGSGMTGGAVICTICGFNKKTGKAAVVKVLKDDGDGDAEAATGAKSTARKIAEAPTMLVLGTLGACIGGVVGAGIWALVAYQIHYEIGWLAIGVGALVGGGMAKGAQGYTGALTGLIAAVIAVGAVLGGRYMAISAIVDDIGKTATKQMAKISEDDAQVELARTVVHEQEEKGKVLKWPDGMSEEEAETQADFPKEVWAEMDKRWAAMSPDQREDYLNQLRKERKELVANVMGVVKDQGFMASFDVIDIVFLLLAVGAGFSIGSGGKSS